VTRVSAVTNDALDNTAMAAEPATRIFFIDMDDPSQFILGRILAKLTGASTAFIY